jgi:hypothetical protein
MQQVYATKQIMKETLDSKKGFWGWVWKTFTHRSETKAMRNYINAAEQALSAANFDQAAENEAVVAMTQKGYLYGSYKRSGAESEIKEKFAENEKKYASMESVSQSPIKDQLFEIKFRPSPNGETFEKQRLEYNAVAKIVEKGYKNKTIPDEVIDVFKATGKKFKLMKNSGLLATEQDFEAIEKTLMDKGNHDNYNAMKFSEVKNLVEQKEIITIKLDNDEVNIDRAKPVDTAPAKEIDPIIKK